MQSLTVAIAVLIWRSKRQEASLPGRDRALSRSTLDPAAEAVHPAQSRLRRRVRRHLQLALRRTGPNEPILRQMLQTCVAACLMRRGVPAPRRAA